MTRTAAAARTRPGARAPFRRTALVAGVLYLLTFVSSIPAVALIAPVLNDPGYVIGAGSDGQVLAGCLLDIVNALACIGTAVALFPVVKRQHEGLALGFVTSRMLEAAVILIGVVCLLAIVTLRQTVAHASGADHASLVSASAALVAARNWTFLLGPSLMPAFNALLLGSLLFWSGLVPRIIPLVGLIGAPLLLAADLARYFGVVDSVSVVVGLATLPIFLWELAVGLWLAIKGFRPSPLLARP
jgi:hypothetical protein